MYKPLCVLIILCLSLSFCPAQKTYGVNEQLPDFSFTSLLNYPKSILTLEDFKGKFIILDFWNIHCASCIEAFPKMEKLQSEFAGKMQVLLVNAWDKKEEVLKLLAKRQRISGLSTHLPMVFNARFLDSLLPHDTVPFYVILDQSRKIKAMPDYFEMKVGNIDALLNDKPVRLAEKAPARIKNDGTKPLFIQGNAGNGEHLLWYTVLSHYVEGLPPVCSMLCNRKDGTNIAILDYSVRGLYQFAYNDAYPNTDAFNSVEGYRRQNELPRCQVELRVRDSLKYEARIGDEYRPDYTYCYQLISPMADYGAAKKAMQEDLKKYFELDARMEKRKMECLVMTCSDSSLLRPSVGPWAFDWTDYGIHIKDFEFPYFVFQLVNGNALYFNRYPLIDETGIKGPVEIQFDADMNDWRSIARALKKYKISLVPEIREVNVLVLAEPGYGDPENSGGN